MAIIFQKILHSLRAPLLGLSSLIVTRSCVGETGVARVFPTAHPRFRYPQSRYIPHPSKSTSTNRLKDRFQKTNRTVLTLIHIRRATKQRTLLKKRRRDHDRGDGTRPLSLERV